MKGEQGGGEASVENKMVQLLYEKYGIEIYRYLYALCGSRELAEDILQETFCKALLSLPDRHGNARAWLYMVGRNLMFNEKKKKSREIPEETVEAGRMGHQEDLPEQLALRREGEEELYRALLKLDARKREILTLNYLDGLTLKEAAGIMGISYENARVLSHRAKQEAKKLMEVKRDEVS